MGGRIDGLGFVETGGGLKKRRQLDEAATAYVELGLKPDEYWRTDQAEVEALHRAWALRERRVCRRYAAIAYVVAQVNGGKVSFDDMMDMVGAPADPDEQHGE